MTTTAREAYATARFEHYRAVGEDHGTASEWAEQDAHSRFGADPAREYRRLIARFAPQHPARVTAEQAIAEGYSHEVVNVRLAEKAALIDAYDEAHDI